jgi:hypothetical protein
LPQPEKERKGVVTEYSYVQHSVIICIMKEINQNYLGNSKRHDRIEAIVENTIPFKDLGLPRKRHH